jgi:uncharacterized membrane protein HdeD (DUF308 family)
MLMRAQDRFARTKGVVLLTGIVMVVLGIAVLINPIGAVETLVRIMGWVLVVYGALTLVNAFMKGDPVRNSPTMLFLGGACLIVGLVMAIASQALVSFVWTIIGIIVFLTGVLDIIEAGAFRSAGNPLAVPATTSGVITAVLGAIVIICPLFSAALGMLLAAVALLVDGITEIIFGLGM